jgi:hypothetical protein
MSEAPEGDRQLPPPLPGPEAAARRARHSVPPPGDSDPSQARRVAKALLIGLTGLLVSAAIPIILVVILAFVAQMVISGH